MGDYISELPDDILCHIFSSLTVRDAFRVKSLSRSWKDLPDSRSHLEFDVYTIFGGESPKFGDDKFEKAIDEFFKIWRAQKASSLKIKYDLRRVSYSVIDGWILTALGKEIEELDLDFSYGARKYSYILSCHLLDTGYLKHLRLTFCRLTLLCDTSTRWLSKLRTLELKDSGLCLEDVECILSSSPNLESLRLGWDDWKFETHKPVIIQLSSLKKLVIEGVCYCHLELTCPKLETFEFSGYYGDVTFSKVPLLKDASLKLLMHPGGCSEEFTSLATNAPLLTTLSLWLRTEVEQPLRYMTIRCLKRLHIIVKKTRKISFNLLGILHYLDACPVLEELILKLDSLTSLRPKDERRHVGWPHLHLKEVEFEGFAADEISTLVEYLLENGVSLQQMVFIVEAKYDFYVTEMHTNCSVWQTINPTVKLIVELKGVQK